MIPMYKKLGATLIEKGQWFLKRAFHIKYTQTITKEELKNFLAGLGLDRNKIYCADRKYYLIDWEVMKDIIEYDWTDKKKYIVDAFDCDNFANAFSSNLAETYGINSAGLAKSIKVTIGDRVVYHRANLILATEDNILKAFVYEAQNDKWQELEKDVPIQIGSWKYELNSFAFN